MPTNPIITTFQEYDDFMKDTQKYYPSDEQDKLNLFAFGVAEEAGEILGKFKRRLRGESVATQDILLEIGDLLGYISCLTQELGSNLDKVVELNVAKIEQRKLNKTLLGSGDDR